MRSDNAVPTPEPGEPSATPAADNASDRVDQGPHDRRPTAADIQQHIIGALTKSLVDLEARSRAAFEKIQAERPHQIHHSVYGRTDRRRELLLLIANDSNAGHGLAYKGIDMHVAPGVEIGDCALGTLAVELTETTKGDMQTLPNPTAFATHTTRYRMVESGDAGAQHVVATERVVLKVDSASVPPEILSNVGQTLEAQGKQFSLRNVELLLTATQSRIAPFEELLALDREIKTTKVHARNVDMTGREELEPVSQTRFVATGDVHVELAVRPKFSRPGVYCWPDSEAQRDLLNETIPASRLDALGSLGEILREPQLLDQLIAATRQRAATIYDDFFRF